MGKKLSGIWKLEVLTTITRVTFMDTWGSLSGCPTIFLLILLSLLWDKTKCVKFSCSIVGLCYVSYQTIHLVSGDANPFTLANGSLRRHWVQHPYVLSWPEYCFGWGRSCDLINMCFMYLIAICLISRLPTRICVIEVPRHKRWALSINTQLVRSGRYLGCQYLVTNFILSTELPSLCCLHQCLYWIQEAHNSTLHHS